MDILLIVQVNQNVHQTHGLVMAGVMEKINSLAMIYHVMVMMVVTVRLQQLQVILVIVVQVLLRVLEYVQVQHMKTHGLEITIVIHGLIVQNLILMVVTVVEMVVLQLRLKYSQEALVK